MRKSLLALLSLIILFTAACTPPYRQTFNDAGKAKGWTQKQTDAAFAYADRTFWSHQVGDNKYVISYGKVPTAKVRQQLEGVLRDIDSGLDPNNAEMVQYLGTFGLRKDVEHDEEVAEAIYTRVRASELKTEFDQKMGSTPSYGPESEIAQGYNVRKIYVDKPMAEAFPFKSDQIEAAKKTGVLKAIEHVELDFSSDYDHKEPNPNNPTDMNDFIWVAKHQSIRLTNYKIINVAKPEDNRGNYIEGFRVTEGKQETLPALKVFFPGDGAMAVVLVDTDEQGQPGFGVPDILVELSAATNVASLIRSNDLLDALFVKKQAKARRAIPETKLFKIEISPLGSPLEEWVKAPSADGWMVPVIYKNERGNNYNVRVHYKQVKFDENTGAAVHEHSDYQEIDYIEKEYTKSGERYEASAGQVVEYFKPKADFAGKVKATVLEDQNTKAVSFEFEDGSVVEGFVTPGNNKFIADTPYAVSYNEGSKRFWIEKSADSKVYDKRKTVGPPKEVTGEYSEDDNNSAADSKPDRSDDGMGNMENHKLNK